jgi:hypothetical protein
MKQSTAANIAIQYLDTQHSQTYIVHDA